MSTVTLSPHFLNKKIIKVEYNVEQGIYILTFEDNSHLFTLRMMYDYYLDNPAEIVPLDGEK